LCDGALLRAAQLARRTGLADPPVAAGLTCYLLLYALLFPSIFATPDESQFLAEAQGIWAGELLECDAESLYRVTDGIRAFRGRSLLFSLVLAPFVGVHWKTAFLVGLGFHLVNFLLAATILGRCKMSKWWAWLILLHPTLSLFSRMVMMDAASATATLAVLALLTARRSHPLSIGLVAGISLFFRVTNCWIGFAAGLHYLVAALWTGGERRSLLQRAREGELWKYLVAYVPFCVGLLISNAILYGGPFESRYGGQGTTVGLFGLEYLVRYLPMRTLGLNVFWPLMLFAVFFLPRRVRVFGVCLVIVQLLFFAASAVQPRGYDLVTTIVRSSRYLMGPIAVLCIGYPAMVSRVLRGRAISKPIVAMVLASCMAATALMFWKHDAFLARQARAVAAVYEHTPPGSVIFAGVNALELIHPVFGKRELRPVNAAYQYRGLSDLQEGHYLLLRVPPPPRSPGQQASVDLGRRLESDLSRIAEVELIAVPEDKSLRIWRVQRRLPGAQLEPFTPDEWRQISPPLQDLPLLPE
jgi:hypothetical protein